MKYQRQNRGSCFGPSLRKPSTKRKPRSKLVKMSREQLKKTREYYRLPVLNRNNNANERGNDDVAKNTRSPNDQQDRVVAQKMQEIPPEKSSNVTVAPQQISPQKNTEKSRPSFSRPNDAVVSSQKNTDKSKPSSLRPNNGPVYPQRNTEKLRRPKNDVVSLAQNTEKSRPSSSRPNNGMISLPENTKKSRHSRFTDEFSSGKLEKPASAGSKDESHPLPVVCNSSNIERSSSRPNRLKTTVAPAHVAKNVARKDGFGRSKLLKSKVVSTSKLSNFLMEKELLVQSKDCLNEHKKCHDGTMSGEVHKEDLWTAKDTPNSCLALKGKQVIQDLRRNSGYNSSSIFGMDLSSHWPAEASCMGNNIGRDGEAPDGCIQHDGRNQNTSLAEDGRTDDGKFKSKKTEPLQEENVETHEDDDSEEAENCRPTKKRRRYIENEDEEDDGGDQNLVGVEGGTAGLTTQTASVKDHHTEVSKPFVSELVKLQHYSSLPIDEPIWSGIFKIGSKEYISLAAHLSTKYCEKVWKLSRSLRPVVEVTKLSRLEAWPKTFEASRPTDDNIALYFLPHEMRPNEDLDQLVKEVVENDMVLRAVVGEAEMLIFPSILLPEQHQTFQRKPYLWGVFKRREDKVAIVEEEQHGTGRCAQEEEMRKQHYASYRGVGKEGYRVAGPNMDVELQAPVEAERQGIEQEPTPVVARSNTPRLAEGVAQPTSAPTMAAAKSANHGQIPSSLGVPAGAMFGFVAGHTPRVEQLIREMEREGAVVVAMRGEMIGSGLGQAIATV